MDHSASPRWGRCLHVEHSLGAPTSKRCGITLARRAAACHHSGVAVVGDRVQVSSRKVGEAPRDGVVTGVTGSLLTVRWSTGEESTVVPSMGSLTVVAKSSIGASRRQMKRTYKAKGRPSL